MPEIADDEPLLLTELQRLHLWVADKDDTPIAWVGVEVLDNAAHIAQLSVHPAHARQGIGAQLLDHVQAWAAEHDLTALTLTTFRRIPWNEPYYRRLGFTEPAHPSPGLQAVLAAEAERGLRPEDRICLHRPVSERA